MQCGSLFCILELKENINRKADEMQIKSNIWLIVMDQCQFLSFDKCTVAT